MQSMEYFSKLFVMYNYWVGQKYLTKWNWICTISRLNGIETIQVLSLHTRQAWCAGYMKIVMLDIGYIDHAVQAMFTQL